MNRESVFRFPQRTLDVAKDLMHMASELVDWTRERRKHFLDEGLKGRRARGLLEKPRDAREPSQGESREHRIHDHRG